MLKRVVGQAGRATLIYFPARLVPAIAAVVALPIFTSYLRPDAYGAYAYVFSTVSFLATLGTAWLTTSAVRFYAPAQREGRLGRYFTSLLLATFGAATAIALLVALSAPIWETWVSPQIAALLMPGLALLLTTAVNGVLLQVLRAAQVPKAFVSVSVPGALLGLLTGYLFLRAGYGPESLLYGQALGYAVMLPFGLFFAIQATRGDSFAPSRSLLLEYASYGLPLVGANVASWVLSLSDRYVIEATRSTAEVGLYSFSYTLADKGMQLVMVPFLLAVSPVIIATWEKEGRKLTEGLQAELSRYFLMLMGPVAAALAVGAPIIVTLMSGDDSYLEGWRVLPWVAAGLLLYGLGQIGVTGIGLGKKTRITMENTVVAAVFNIGANILLVPRFGYVAAAMTTLVSYILLFAMTMIRSRVVLRWRVPLRAVAKVAAACLPLSAVLVVAQWAVEPSWPMAIVAFISAFLAYSVAILAIGGIDAEERAWLAARVRGMFQRG